MMKKISIWIFLALIVGLLVMVGCSKQTATTLTTLTATTSTQPVPNEYQPLLSQSPNTSIFGRHGANTSQSEIILDGSVNLPDGIILRTALYVVNPEQWWPIEQDIPVQNRTWAITIKPGQNGAPDVLPSHNSGFTVLVWQKDDLSVFLRYPVLIIGPVSGKN